MKSRAKTERVPFFRSNCGSKVVSGHLSLSQQIPLDEILESEGQTLPDSIAADVAVAEESCVLCLLVTPSILIPCDLVRLLASYCDHILAIRILQHTGSGGKYMSLIYTTDGPSAHSLQRQFHGRALTSLDPTLALIYGVTGVSLGDDSSAVIASSSSSGPADPLQDAAEEDCICVLCLETMAPSPGHPARVFSMCCGHSFHLSCVTRLENPQCPVCRYQHDDMTETLSCCQECGWRGPSEAAGRGLDSGDNGNKGPADMALDSDNDLWLCLVCGYIGCGGAHLGHIQRHYEQHLHTYVMNTESRRVYDFAGGGYVHRLLLQQADRATAPQAISGPNHGFGPTVPHDKLVESSNPRATDATGMRPATAELSSEQEELMVHRKLEAVAAQYSNILTIQLNRQRQQYETQLRLLETKFNSTESVVGDTLSVPAERLEPSAARCVSPTGGGEWAGRVMTSLRAERQRLQQQRDNVQARLSRSEKEHSVLEALNQSLVANHGEWRKLVEEAEAGLSAAELALRRDLPPLERRVRELMLQLERGTSTPAGDS